jgi:hypothetical protein
VDVRCSGCVVAALQHDFEEKDLAMKGTAVIVQSIA